MELFKIPEIDVVCDLVNKERHLPDAPMNTTTIADTNHNLSQLKFLEVYYIKTHNPAIYVGLKASQELWISISTRNIYLLKCDLNKAVTATTKLQRFVLTFHE